MAGTLIIADHLRGSISDVTREMVTLAQSMRDTISGPVMLACIGKDPSRLSPQCCIDGIDEVYGCDVGSDNFDAFLHEEVVIGLGMSLKPKIILFGHTANGMGCAAAVAARLGSGFASDIFGVRSEAGDITVSRGAYGGKLNVDLAFPNKGVIVLTVRGASFKPAKLGNRPHFVEMAFDTPAVSRHVEYVDAPESDLDVSAAPFILSVGRGIQEEANLVRFESLAKKIGATFACSRPIVDAGWLPKAHQIGQSGTVARQCKLYIALGISGAVQHVYGIKNVGTIVAVNTDANAPIFGVANYGACVDLFEFGDALAELFT